VLQEASAARSAIRVDRGRTGLGQACSTTSYGPVRAVGIRGRTMRTFRARTERNRADAGPDTLDAAPRGACRLGPGLINIHRVAHRQPCARRPISTRPTRRRRWSRGGARAAGPAAPRLSICSSRLTRPKRGNLALRSVSTAALHAAAARAETCPALTHRLFMRAFRPSRRASDAVVDAVK